MTIPRKYLLTGAVILVAVVVVLLKYWDYVANPWTRDGQVRAEVIQITPRVSGPIVRLPIRDNQFVNAGDLLFEIDPRTFQANLDSARAQLDQTGDNVLSLEKQVEAAEAAVEVSRGNIAQSQSSILQTVATIEKNRAEYVRQQNLLPQKATSQKSVERAKANLEVAVQEKNAAEASLLQSRASLAESEATLAEAKANLGALGESNPQLRTALAALRQAELDLEFTRVRAPVDGYVTNLNLRLGSQAVTNQPALALVDVASYWISGFFRENMSLP
jgi:multidrug resistance efflux pump